MRGILANHDSNAARTEFGKRIATSKGGSRRSNRTDERSRLAGSGMIASISGTSFHTGAIFSWTATVTRASGRAAFIARTAGTLIAASPSQLLERIRIWNGFKSLGETPGGR